jgi:hypothetical protein
LGEMPCNAAKWNSGWLLIEWSLVRIQPGEPYKTATSRKPALPCKTALWKAAGAGWFAGWIAGRSGPPALLVGGGG